MWKSIDQIQNALSISDADFSEQFGIKSFKSKRTRSADFGSSSLLKMCDDFGLTIETIHENREIDLKNLIANYKNDSFVMRSKYDCGAKAMRSTLDSILSLANKKFIYQFIVKDLQISGIEKMKGDTVSLKLINDAFDSIDSYLSMSNIRSISEDNFERFRKTLDQEYFSKLKSSKEVYENFMGMLTIGQDIFDYTIDHVDEKCMNITAIPTDKLTESLGKDYDNEITLIQRMFFAGQGNLLHGKAPAKTKILSSTLQGDQYTRFSFQYG